MHECERCTVERPAYQFLEEDLVAVVAGSVSGKKCIRCKVQAKVEKEPDCDGGKKYECTTCHETKQLQDFSPSNLKSWLCGGRYDNWVCFECRFPPCEKCTKRPVHAVGHNHLIGDKYYCLPCKYPPCRGCGKSVPGKAQPSTKYRFKEWLCGECVAKSNKLLKCGACDADIQSDEIVRKPKGKTEGQEAQICSACAFPTCGCCGATSKDKLSLTEAEKWREEGAWYRNLLPQDP
jgi:hypothetical protein